MRLPIEDIKTAKFPEGQKMTVDEVAEVVGPEFKEMNENPPDEVKKLRKDMEESMSSDLLPVERAASPSKIQLGSYVMWRGKKALVLDVLGFPPRKVDLRWTVSGTPGSRNEVSQSKRGVPVSEIEVLGKSASEQEAEKLEAEAEANEAQAEADRQKADAARMKESAGGLYGYTKGTQRDVEATIRKAQRKAAKLAKALHGQDHQAMDFLRVHAKRANSKTARLLLALMQDYPQADLLPIEQIKQAEDTPMGMYGYPSGTARLALDACSALRSGIGEVAYNLHSRRMAKHERITGFLKEHSKAAKCGYTRLLLDTYPEAPRLAAKKKLPEELEEHQFTSEDNPNPKGNDRDGDGQTNEPSPVPKKARSARRHFAGRRYDYDEVIDFLTDDNSTPELEKMWKKWSAMVEDLHDRWFEGWAKANAPELVDEGIDYKELAWKAFGSVSGMGVGLWEGDVLGDEHGKAFEKVVERDSKVSRFGHDLDDEISLAKYDAEEEMSKVAMLRKAFVPDSVDGWLEWEDGTRTAASKTARWMVTVHHRSNRTRDVNDLVAAFSGEFGSSGEDGRGEYSEVHFVNQQDLYDFSDAAEQEGLNVSMAVRMASTRRASIYSQNQKAMVAEAGNSLKLIDDPAKLARAVVKLNSFHKMVDGSIDMVKDALIALEEGGAIPLLDDYDFQKLRDQTERRMFFRRASVDPALPVEHKHRQA